MLKSIFSSSVATMDLSTVLIASIVSLILGVIIALTHKFTGKYSKNFLIAIATLPLLVQTVIIMVNGNLGTSVAIAGTFSLIRFRSMPGTAKEIIVVFFAMAIGVATGMGHLAYAAIITVIGSLALILFCKTSFLDLNRQEKILKILIPEDLDYTEVFDDVFNRYVKSFELEQVKTTNMGSMFDLSYRIVLKNGIKEKDFIDELRVKNGNLKIILTHPIQEGEL